jgi:hypothetical protein
MDMPAKAELSETARLLQELEADWFVADHVRREPGNHIVYDAVINHAADWCQLTGASFDFDRYWAALEKAGFTGPPVNLDNCEDFIFHDIALVPLPILSNGVAVSDIVAIIEAREAQAKRDFARLLRLVDGGASRALVRQAIVHAQARLKGKGSCLCEDGL